MIGIYNYTVIITYLSVVFAGMGMYFAGTGSLKLSVFMLMMSGLCDMFDGIVARTKKNRTATEKAFGIQIDSLCDCVSFGVQPAVFLFCYAVHNNASEYLKIVALVVGIVLALCAIIRLAYFNVTEEERQQVEGSKRRTSYQGLPVTNVAFMVPLGFMGRYFASGDIVVWIMVFAMALTAFLFVLNFKMIKAHGRQNIWVILLGLAICFGAMLS